MNNHEVPHYDRFDDLMEEEIARMRNPKISDPPVHPNPLSMREYKELAMQKMVFPSREQLQYFFRSFENDIVNTFRVVNPGDKLLPVVMPHEHGFPKFEPERLKRYGCLYYYVMDYKNIAMLPENVVCLSAIFPPEIIQNSVVITPDHRNIENMIAIQKQFEKATLKMLEMIRNIKL